MVKSKNQNETIQTIINETGVNNMDEKIKNKLQQILIKNGVNGKIKYIDKIFIGDIFNNRENYYLITMENGNEYRIFNKRG